MDANNRIAEDNHGILARKGVKAIDIMGAIGSGKTFLIERLIEVIRAKGIVPAAIVGDVAGDDDFKRLRDHEIEVVNINTGKDCHLDAHMIDHALETLKGKEFKLLFIENVGNLVCPADFPLGADIRMVVISVTEGDDMIRKHPTLMGKVDIIIINKVELAQYVDVDPMILIRDAEAINPHARVILTDAKTGRGIDELAEALGLFQCL